VGDVLTALGRPLHVGRRTQVWEVRIQKDGRNAAFFTCTQMVLSPYALGGRRRSLRHSGTGGSASGRSAIDRWVQIACICCSVSAMT
jgi:hypothetical protein